MREKQAGDDEDVERQRQRQHDGAEPPPPAHGTAGRIDGAHVPDSSLVSPVKMPAGWSKTSLDASVVPERLP